MSSGATDAINMHRDGAVEGEVLSFLEGILSDLLQDGGGHARVAIIIEDGREVCVRTVDDDPVGSIGHDKALPCPVEWDMSCRGWSAYPGGGNAAIA